MKTVLAFDPDIVVLGADPPQLDCCDLLSEIKGSKQTHNIRVVMLSPGGSGERTRGLDLGADDVLSLPFDSHELLARVRSQLRNKYIADEFQERLRLAEDNRNSAQQMVTAVNEEKRTLRIGGVAAIAVLIVAALALIFFYRRGQQQNTRVYAAITRLQTGIADATTIDGTLAARPGRSGTQPIPGERSANTSTSEKERRAEITNCNEQDARRFRFAKSVGHSRRPPSEA